ncbi:MAG: phenylalanine--tRNA ligase beta subunit-related protein [Caldiserica bacterium]|jgi:lysyl-tRNA synthetase class 2|nr:phenylalanine--tRNA ligase beta subunit-related protein [Caldisericota bacterium]MDH7562376.1 phenylalanine--tRNA ligase beta subunit-related protein [Caldisericota bacterium]
MRKIIIEEGVFQIFPNFKRGLVIVSDMKNEGSNPEIEELLENQRVIRQGCPLDREEITAWEEMHRRFGSNPNKFPPSIKSLIKRAQRGDRIPFVNSVVALFNYISLKYLLPCGGDDLDKIQGNLRLGIATGEEEFVPLGGWEIEHPVPGEIIYYDDLSKRVMCRKWNWRNGDFSKILESTRRVVINVDGAETVPEKRVIEARDELADLLSKHCSATLTTDLLNAGNREIILEI